MDTIKGFQDFTGELARKRAKIKKILTRNFELYGFQPVETPIIEAEEFVRGTNQNDEAVSDIFKLEDKGKRNLALRYELTFQLKRLAGNKKLPYKRYQIGEVFRDEPVSSNRFRQFTQCDIDIIGSSIKEEAEILALASKILDELGIKAVIYFNNRKLLNEILDKQGVKQKEEVIRILDKLDKKPENEVKAELSKFKAEKILSIIQNKAECKKYSSYKEIQELIDSCKIYGVEIDFLPSLARGLSYYNGSVFEIKNSSERNSGCSEKGSFSDIKTREMKETICAGGSYLVNNIQSSGISFGLERLSQLAKIKTDEKVVLLISIGEDKETIKLGEKLRKQNIPVIIMYGKISKALEYANSYNIPYTIFIGEEEIKKRKFKLKDMKSGKESLLKEKEIIEKLS